MKKLNLFWATMLALVLSACAASPTSRSTGQTLDDTAITTRVKAEIAKAPGVKEAATINVDTYRGVVSLAGFLDSSQQIDKAVVAARAVPGVEKVVNNLRVKSAP